MGLMAHRVPSAIWLCVLSTLFSLEVAITRTINAVWSPPPSFREALSEQGGSSAMSAAAAQTAAGTTPPQSFPREKVPGAGYGPGE